MKMVKLALSGIGNLLLLLNRSTQFSVTYRASASSGMRSQTHTFCMLGWLSILDSMGMFCSDQHMLVFCITVTTLCCENVCSSAKLISSIWLVVHLCCFKFVFLPQSQFSFCVELLALPVCSKPVACLTVCITTVCVHCEKVDAYIYFSKKKKTPNPQGFVIIIELFKIFFFKIHH